ncbi:MAG TPA: immunoglobulin domain-containing protein, partial [Verrucomicrobiae bacterium]|nr:immunoglobulin domain-containing protein [Verrucomicrobiae bacterium]
TAVSNLDLTLDDLAPAMLPDNGAITASYFRPADYEPATNEMPAPAPAGPYGNSFNIFTGTDPNGTWKLYLVDDTIKDQATLRNGWRLDIWGRDPMADLAVSAIATPELLAVGNNVTVAVMVSNRGPATASAVVLTNPYGTNLSFSGATSSQGSCTNDSGILRCTLGEISPGGSAFVQISLTALAAGTVSNSVGVTSSSIDLNPANNLSTAVFVAENPPRIVRQPRDQHVASGATAVFDVIVTGDSPLSYQWYYDVTPIPGATTSALTIADVQPAKFGNYRVEISNRVGVVLSSIAVLGAPRPPVIATIVDQLGQEDTLLTVPLAISDPDDPLEVFQLSGVCNDTNLVPTTNLAFAVSGTNYALLIRGATNQFGTNVITVNVTDSAGLSATTSFVLGLQAVNDYPEFLVPVGDQVISEDIPKTVFFEIGDVETPDTALIVGARSYNQTLLPDNLIGLGGTNHTRYIIIAPARNQYGTAVMEIRIRDEAGVRSTNLFTVTVQPVEDRPSISGIGDVTIPEDGELNANFTVDDVETLPADLVVRAESSNPALFSAGAFSFEATGNNRTLRARPMADQNGTSRITIFVEDQAGLVASNAFLVTVDPVNDPPFVSAIPEIITPMDTTSAAVAFTVGDLESDATNLTVTAISTNTALAPLSGIQFGGSGSNLTVRVTPGTGQLGWMVLQVAVADTNGGVTTREFELTVHPTNGAPLIVRQPEQQTLTLGAPLKLRVIAKGPGPLRYQWQHEGVELLDQTNSIFALAAVAGSDRGDYRVRISNDEGTVLSEPARVNVLEGTRILSIRRIAGTVELTFSTISVQHYVVEYQDSLDAPWTALPELTGTGGIVTVTDPAAAGSKRFYRVRVQ